MRATSLSACYISPDISVEQFIPEHFFLYLAAGSMTVYDGHKEYHVAAGDYGMGRRNHLAKYSKKPHDGKFEKVVMIFDQTFLKTFYAQHGHATDKPKTTDSVISLNKSPRIENFIHSLTPYFNDKGAIDTDFLDVKRTELLLLLLKERPDLAPVLFDFGHPEKLDMEAFMRRNYKFNLSLERFAYLTGRSLSAFKRDFKETFHTTPGHWLVQKRLEEAYFLLDKKAQKPSEIYLDLGFEDLSHFSFAFKKMYGMAPTQVLAQASAD